jgi:hypothetical protein
MKDDRFRAFEVLVAVFLIGIIIGAAGIYIWQTSSKAIPESPEAKIPPQANGPLIPPNNPPPKTPEFNLTEEQEEQLRPIWRETGEKLRLLERQQREEGDNKRKEIWDENDQKVRSVLNQEQQEIFDVWIEEVRKWRERPLLRRRGMESPKENRKQPKENRKQPERQ